MLPPGSPPAAPSPPLASACAAATALSMLPPGLQAAEGEGRPSPPLPLSALPLAGGDGGPSSPSSSSYSLPLSSTSLAPSAGVRSSSSKIASRRTTTRPLIRQRYAFQPASLPMKISSLARGSSFRRSLEGVMTSAGHPKVRRCPTLGRFPYAASCGVCTCPLRGMQLSV